MLLTVFFDSDALVAGSASRSGASFLLLQLCELGLLKGVTCQCALGECRRNLKKKLPDALPVFNRIIEMSVKVIDNPSNKSIQRVKNMAHLKDLSILAATVQCEANYLITFNIKHFHPAPAFSLEVCKPGDLLKKIRILLNTMAV